MAERSRSIRNPYPFNLSRGGASGAGERAAYHGGQSTTNKPFTKSRPKALLKKAGLSSARCLAHKEDLMSLKPCDSTLSDDHLLTGMIVHPDRDPAAHRGQRRQASCWRARLTPSPNCLCQASRRETMRQGSGSGLAEGPETFAFDLR